MLKQLNRAELDQLLHKLAAEYRLQVPQQLADGTRQLAPYGDGELSLFGAVVHRKPTAYFFPQTERLLNIDASGAVTLPLSAEKPLALFGLNKADLAGITFLDRFFTAAPADDVYLRNRNGALLIGLTGAAGPDHSFLPLSAGDCDIELIAIREGWLALGHSAVGEKPLLDFPAGDSERLTALRKFSDSNAGESDLLQQASRLLMEDKVPDQFWTEIADRCILCSGCNLSVQPATASAFRIEPVITALSAAGSGIPASLTPSCAKPADTTRSVPKLCAPDDGFTTSWLRMSNAGESSAVSPADVATALVRRGSG